MHLQEAQSGGSRRAPVPARPAARSPTRLPVLVAALLTSFAAISARGQDFVDQLRREEAATRQDLQYSEWTRPAQQQRVFEFGAWSAPSFLSFSDLSANKATPDIVRSALVLDERVWGRWDNPGGQTVYVRARYLNLARDVAPGAVAPAVFETGFDLDLGYYDIPADNWRFRLGRQYLALGRGLTLSQNLDAAKASFTRGAWNGFSFFGRTPAKTTDLDPFIGRSDRELGGLELEYHTRSDQKLFAYGLDNADQTNATLPGQGLRYNSQYYSLGAAGRMVGDVAYSAEKIFERGDSATAGSATARSPIDADATALEAVWRPSRKHHPTLSAGYFYGSGDGDRGSVLSSAAGNAAGTPDNAFIGLGRFEGGLALSPRLSNLVEYRLGGTWTFLEHDADFQTLQLGGYLSSYSKDVAAGPISNPGAVVASADVGTGLDVSLQWKPENDLTMALQAGEFLPGAAFPSTGRTNATALFANLTYSY